MSGPGQDQNARQRNGGAPTSPTALPLPAAPSFPAPPLPVWHGAPVSWEPWAAGARVTHIDQSCGACKRPGPLLSASGVVTPLPGATMPSSRTRRTRSGRTYGVAIEVPAWPVRELWATLCPGCHDLTLMALGAEAGWDPVQILCDGCDVLCAAGADLPEARTVLAERGGWSAADADWDLCPACSPTNTAEPAPRPLHPATHDLRSY